jgi:5-formyltetrahydrofolate cyclo-ligase
MEWYRIDDFEGLEQGAYGIEEPVADPARLMEVPGPGTDVKAVAIVPGYSFDDKGYRLGYGGGYYDVFLPTFGGASVGLCRRQQWSEEPLNFDEHDVPVDYVVIG